MELIRCEEDEYDVIYSEHDYHEIDAEEYPVSERKIHIPFWSAKEKGFYILSLDFASTCHGSKSFFYWRQNDVSATYFAVNIYVYYVLSD